MRVYVNVCVCGMREYGSAAGWRAGKSWAMSPLPIKSGGCELERKRKRRRGGGTRQGEEGVRTRKRQARAKVGSRYVVCFDWPGKRPGMHGERWHCTCTCRACAGAARACGPAMQIT